VPCPTDIDIQRRIADILSAYDDLIENNNRRIALLEESMRLLYREWFVRLRFPGYEHVRIMDGLPEGWSKNTLGDIVLEMRRQLDPSDVEPDSPYVGLEHIPRKSIALANWGKASDVTSSKFRFEKDEILFGKIRPYFHKVVFAPVDGICSSDTIVYRPKQSEYFGLALGITSSEDFVSYTSKSSNEGAKMPRANTAEMRKYPILVPDQGILTDSNRIITDITSLIGALVMMNRRLSEARDLLLPRLMSGEIVVPTGGVLP
jgi:type I restriction enzyme S subunit